LVGALREAVLTGRLPAGARLPPSRLLAAQLGLSRGTVVAAYEELVSEGYCAARVGAGTFVLPMRDAASGMQNGAAAGRQSLPAASPAAAGAASEPAARTPFPDPDLSAWGHRLARRSAGVTPARPMRFDFRRGTSPSVFPAAALARALRLAALRLAGQEWPGDPAGSARLRRALVAYLGRARGLRADPSQVIVVSGSQQGVDLAARLLLDPGDQVCIEDPGYPRARECFHALGAVLLPVPVDRTGLMTGSLPAGSAHLAYVTPSHQYPTGAVLAPDRRLALLDWAERHGAWILEDDYDSEYRYTGPPLPCLQGLDRSGRCLYLGTLSKLLHPALRAGYLVVPPALVPAAIAAKNALDQATTPIVQEALADLFESGEIERHLRRAGRDYRTRRARLLSACAEQLPPDVRLWPVTGGLHAYLEVPGVSDAALHEEAARRGLELYDARDCRAGGSDTSSVILWFSRILPGDIAPGIAALGAAIRAARARS
jgi:GntR family transcriptional regulator/MocR family aminotransferase